MTETSLATARELKTINPATEVIIHTNGTRLHKYILIICFTVFYRRIILNYNYICPIGQGIKCR
jgi:hypothetical protein